MSCQNSANPAPPSTISARNRITNCLRFIPAPPYAPPSRGTCASSNAAPLRKCQRQPRQRDQQRHEPDVHDLSPELELLALHTQVLADILELDPRLRRLLAEVVDLHLLLGRQDHARARPRLAFLQLLKFLLRLIQAVLQFLDLAQVLLL